MLLIIDRDLQLQAFFGTSLPEGADLCLLDPKIMDHDFPVKDPGDLDLASFESFLRLFYVKLAELVHAIMF